MTTPTPRFKPDYYALLNQAVYQNDSQAAIRQFSNAKVLEEANILGWKMILVQRGNEKCAVIRGSDSVSNWGWNIQFALDTTSHIPHRALIQEFNRQVRTWEQTHGEINATTGHSAAGYYATHILKDRQLSRITFNSLLPVRNNQIVNFRTSNDILTGISGSQNCIDIGEGSHGIDDVVTQIKGQSWQQVKKSTHAFFAITQGAAEVSYHALTSYFSHPPAIGKQLYRQAQHEQRLNRTRLQPSFSTGLSFSELTLSNPASYQEEIAFLTASLSQLQHLRFAALQTRQEAQHLAEVTTSHAMRNIKSHGKKIDRSSKVQTGLSFVEKVIPGATAATSIISGWFRKKGEKQQKKITKKLQQLEVTQQAFLSSGERADHQTSHLDQTTHSILTRITSLSLAILSDSESTTIQRQAALHILLSQHKAVLEQGSRALPPHPTHKKARALQRKQDTIEAAIHDHEDQIRRRTTQTEVTALESQLSEEQRHGPQRDYEHQIDKARRAAAPYQSTVAGLHLALRTFFESLSATGCLNLEHANHALRTVDGSFGLFQAFAFASDLFTQIKTAHLTPGVKVPIIQACSSLLAALSFAARGIHDLLQAKQQGVVTTQDLSFQIGETEERLKEELATLYTGLYTTKQALEQEIHTTQNILLARFSRHEHQQTVTRLKDKIATLEEVKSQWNPSGNIDDFILRLLGFCRTISFDSNNGYINSSESWTPSAELSHLHDHPELFTGLLGKFDGQILPNAAIYEQLLKILEIMTQDLQGRSLPTSTKTLLEKLCTNLDTVSQALRYFENNIALRREALRQSAEKHKQKTSPPLSSKSLTITGSRKFYLYDHLTQKPAGTVLTPTIVSNALKIGLWSTPTQKSTQKTIQSKSLRTLLDNQKENPPSVPTSTLYIGVDLKQKTLRIVPTEEVALLACHFVQERLFVRPVAPQLKHLPTIHPDYHKTVHELMTNYYKFLHGKPSTPFDARLDNYTILPSTNPKGVPLAFPSTLLAAIKVHLKVHLKDASFWLPTLSSQTRYSFSPKKGTLTIIAPSGQEVTIATFDQVTITAFRPDPLSPHIVEEEFLIQALYCSFASSPLGLPGPNSISIQRDTETICIAPAEESFEGLYQLWQKDPHQAIHYNTTVQRQPLTSSPTPPKPVKYFADLDDTCHQHFYLTLAWLKLLTKTNAHSFQSYCDDFFSPISTTLPLDITGGFLPNLQKEHTRILAQARALLS